VDGREWRIVV